MTRHGVIVLAVTVVVFSVLGQAIPDPRDVCNDTCRSKSQNPEVACRNYAEDILLKPWGKQYLHQSVLVDYRLNDQNIEIEERPIVGRLQCWEEDTSCCECWVSAIEDEMAARRNHVTQKPVRDANKVDEIMEQFREEISRSWLDAVSGSVTSIQVLKKELLSRAQTQCQQFKGPSLPCNELAALVTGTRSKLPWLTTTPNTISSLKQHLPTGAGHVVKNLFEHIHLEAVRRAAEVPQEINRSTIESGFQSMVTQKEPPLDPYHLTHQRGPKRPNNLSPEALATVDAKREFIQWYMGEFKRRLRIEQPDEQDAENAIANYCSGQPGFEFGGWKQ